jgi:hypothetical protein
MMLSTSFVKAVMRALTAALLETKCRFRTWLQAACDSTAVGMF